MGGTESHNTVYEQERLGVDRRQYGEVSTTGFQSQEEYDKVMSGDTTGLKYDSDSQRYSLASGVDLEAAKADWENYSAERSEKAKYTMQEERRKSAPDTLSGTSGNVDYSLATSSTATATGTTPSSTLAIDTSPTVSSSSQALGIY